VAAAGMACVVAINEVQKIFAGYSQSPDAEQLWFAAGVCALSALLAGSATWPRKEQMHSSAVKKISLGLRSVLL
jgi:hypothetical protein